MKTFGNIAKEVSLEVIKHVDTKYPDMWKGVPKNARRQLRDYVYFKTFNALKLASNQHAEAFYNEILHR